MARTPSSRVLDSIYELAAPATSPARADPGTPKFAGSGSEEEREPESYRPALTEASQSHSADVSPEWGTCKTDCGNGGDEDEPSFAWHGPAVTQTLTGEGARDCCAQMKEKDSM